MTKEVAKAIWEAKYKQKLDWAEIADKIAADPSSLRQNAHYYWRRYGIRCPKKYQRLPKNILDILHKA